MDDLNAAANILQIIVTAVVSIAGSYLVFRNRLKETDASVEVAKINNQDDVLSAYGSLQTQLAKAAENMVAPLNLQIAEQSKRLTMQTEELKQLRDYVKQKSNELERVTKRVHALEEENTTLRQSLDKALANERRLRDRLNKIRKDIDTGELPSSVHPIPKSEDDETNNGD